MNTYAYINIKFSTNYMVYPNAVPGGVSTGAVLGIIASVGLMLILIVAGISVLALWYSCGAGHKQMLKR